MREGMEQAYVTAPSDFDVSQQGLFVVVPSIRPDVLGEFIATWVDEDLDVRFVIVHDAESLPENICPNQYGELVTHWCWGDIANELGDDEWIIPRRTDCVRSFGFLKAIELGAKYIVSMDDDVRLPQNVTPLDHWAAHLSPLIGGMHPTYSTTYDRDHRRPRGLLSMIEDVDVAPIPVAINHGLWDGFIDRHGRDEITILERDGEIPYEELPKKVGVVPYRFMYPMCGMNVCFDTRILSAMYFTLQGSILSKSVDELTQIPYDRWGDIWCGMISKNILDFLQVRVTTGIPHVIHNKCSNPRANAQKERMGFDLHPLLSAFLLQHRFDSDLVCPPVLGDQCRDAQSQLSYSMMNWANSDPRLNEIQSRYLSQLVEAMGVWRRLTVEYAN